MQVNVFNDWFSLGHLVLGLLTPVSLLFFLGFLLYELVEFMYKKPKGKEKVEDFLGDLFEFMFGAGFSTLFLSAVGFPKLF